MKSRIKTLFIIIAVLFTAAALTAAADEWKLILNKKGIKVYTRPAEGCPLDQFMGVAVIDAPLETCAMVLRDADNQVKWMGDCLKSHTLKKISNDHFIVYNVLHATWPLSNRDLQIDTVFIDDFAKGIVTVKMKAHIEPIQPVSKKYVRITDMKATCIMKRIEGNKTRVTYINRVNPMAPVPSGIANMIVKKNPYKTLLGLRKMARLPKYKK